MEGEEGELGVMGQEGAGEEIREGEREGIGEGAGRGDRESGDGGKGACGGGGFGGGICVIGARGGGGIGGGTWSCGGVDGGRGSCRSPSSIFLEKPLEREFTPFFLQMTARVWGGGGGGGGGGSLPLLSSPNGTRGERAHLRPTTQKPKNIIIIIKDPQRREIKIKEGPLKHVVADLVQNEERR